MSAPVIEPAFDRPEIDFLILADSSEAINGKLYMLGGGWDYQAVENLEQPTRISIALGVLVPWTFANEQIIFRLVIEDEDGSLSEQIGEGTFVMGRPPTAQPGQPFRIIVTMNGLHKFPRYGTYRMICTVGESTSKRVRFTIQRPGAPQI
jgi:hypothetical protein